MTKTIVTGTIAFAFILFLTFSFKSAENEKKEYLTIFSAPREITLSHSDGTFKSLSTSKVQGNGDQTEILKLICEQEAKGYKLINYNVELQGTFTYATALLAK